MQYFSPDSSLSPLLGGGGKKSSVYGTAVFKILRK